MRAKVIGIEKFAKCGADMNQAKAGEMCGLLLEFISTTESATQIGPQRGPSSSAKINAETKQAQRELDLAGEQRDDDQVVAGRKCCFCEEFQKDGEMDDHLLKVHHYAS